MSSPRTDRELTGKFLVENGIEFRALAGESAEQDLLIGTSVVRLSVPPGLVTNNGRGLVQNRNADLIFKINGLEPTAADPTTGQTLFRPSTLEVVGTEMTNLRMVRASSIDSAVHVRYEERVNG